MGCALSIGGASGFLVPDKLDGPVESREEVLEVFLENDDRVPFELCFPVLLALHEVQEYVSMPVFLHIEEVRPFTRDGARRKDLSP